jgi:hypothetical protein
MKRAICELVSVSPYSQSRVLQETIDKKKETHEDFERRTWIQRCHFNEDGKLFIPPMSFKNCLSEAAKYKSIQIPGKGKSTYTKHFEAGVLVYDPLVLNYTAETIGFEWLHVPSDGMRGGTKRVMKCFPVIPKWSGKVEFWILDEIINEEVFRSHLDDAGSFIGVGRFRPRNNGFYGRFKVESVTWK